MMSDGFVLLLLLPEGKARLRWSRDPGRSLRESFSRGRRDLCVGAVECSPEVFERLTGLPLGTFPMGDVRALSRTDVDPAVRVPVARHNARVIASPEYDEAQSLVEWRAVGGKQQLLVAAPGQGSRGGLNVRETAIGTDAGADDGPGRRGGGMFSADWYDRLVVGQMLEAGHGASIIETGAA